MDSVSAAKLDLAALDILTRAAQMQHRSAAFNNPVAVGVAKAVSLAAIHPGIESRIVCRNPTEAYRSLAIIYSHELRARENAKWNVAEAGLEMPNGSLVVVMLDGEKVVPK